MAKRRKTAKAAAATALVVGSLATAPISPAHAEYAVCASTNKSYFDGWVNLNPPSGYSVEGASAQIVVRYGGVCDSDQSQDTYLTLTTNGDVAWEMVQGGDGSGLQYSQAGYIRWYNSAIYNFSEFNDHHGNWRRTDDFAHPLTQGTSYKYQSLYNGTCHCIINSANGTAIDQTTFNPFSAWSAPFGLDYFGEVHYLESDIPGNATVKTHMSDLQRQDQGTGSLTGAIPFLTSYDDNIFRWADGQYTTCSDGYACFDVWTFYH